MSDRNLRTALLDLGKMLCERHVDDDLQPVIHSAQEQLRIAAMEWERLRMSDRAGASYSDDYEVMP